jgi:predicted permease
MSQRWIRTLRLRLRSLLGRRYVDRELDEELRYHVERLIAENVARGMSADEARHAAMREMGGVEQRKEECRDARGWGWLDDLVWDTRFALRTLRKAPLFSLTVIGSLAVGIGATTAVFSAVNALLVRRLPYPEPDRLMWIKHEGRRLNEGATASFGVHFEDWSRHARTVEAIAAFTDTRAILTGAGEPVSLFGLQVSPSFFAILGASMSRGRAFLPEENRPGSEPVAVISFGLWQGRLGADPNVIGRLLHLDDRDVRVVGVLAPAFRTFTYEGDVWLPLAMDAATLRAQRQVWIRLLARLKPGVAPETAEAELQEILNVHEAGEERFREGRVRLTRFQDHLLSGSERLLLILLGAVSLILLIACTNAASLLLARAAARQKEQAIFAALGAGRFRLVRRMLTECLLLASAAGTLGVGLAFAIVALSTALSPPGLFGPIRNVATVDLDRHVLAFTMAASLLSAVGFGLAPALQFSRPDLTRSLMESGGRDGSARHRARSAFVVVQVALALVLLVGAGLLLRSFVTLVRVDTGYRADDLLTLRLVLPKARYPEHAARALFQQQLLERLRAVGGVESAAAATNVPLTDAGDLFFGTEKIGTERLNSRNVRVGLASPGYFQAMGIALRQGRDFGERDGRAVPPVLIVTESFARLVFPGEDPLGKTVPMPPSIFKEPATIVGVVDDIAREAHRERKPELYLPFHDAWNLPMMTFVVRSRLDPAVLAASLRREIHALDSELLVRDVRTMNERLAGTMAPRRFVLAMLSLLAVVALVLASGGVYGMIAYVVAQRTHEVGIRRALGAQPWDVVRMFVGQGMRLGFFGIALGLVAALALSRVTASLLFGITPTDPLTFASVAVLFIALVWISCWLPARRATQVAPAVALRQE